MGIHTILAFDRCCCDDAFSALAPSRVDVLRVLCFRRNDKTGACFPSMNTIATQSRWSLKTVRESLRDLEAAGWIRIVSKGSGRTSSRFEISLERSPQGGVSWKELSVEAGERELHEGATLPSSPLSPSDTTPESGIESETNQEENLTCEIDFETILNDPKAGEWLKRCQYRHLADRVEITCPNEFYEAWINKRYREDLADYFRKSVMIRVQPTSADLATEGQLS